MPKEAKTDEESLSDAEKAVKPSEKHSSDVPEPEHLKYEKAPWYLRVPLAATSAPPPRGTMGDAPIIPEAKAGFLSLLTFEWMSHILALGYARPLTQTDLYKLQDTRSSTVIADRIVESFERRRKAAEEYNAKLASGEIKPSFRQVVWWTLRRDRANREKQWREKDAIRKPSLVWAMNDSIKWWFWTGGILKVVSDVAQVTSPLVVKAIIKFAQVSYASRLPNAPAQNVPPLGKGMGLAVGLFLLQIIASLGIHHCFYRSASTGVLLRGGLITAIYNRALRLTSRARGTMTNGRLVNHISTDISRIDFCCQFFHMGWTAPIQMIICLILLILQIGPSALAGFAFFILASPVLTVVMKKLIIVRKKSMAWTDKRAKLIQELLGGMRIMKFFAWEDPFLKRIGEHRDNEVKHIRTILLIRSGANAVAFSLPVLASVIAFVAYALSGHELEPAVIFTALTLFQLLRMPLMFLPMTLSTTADAISAINRLQDAFTAETFEHTLSVESGAIVPDLPVAIEVHNASFTWDAPPPSKEIQSKKDKKNQEKQEKKNKGKNPADESTVEKVPEERIFKVQDVSLSIPRGQLCAIVGSVGAGKSSLLQGIIGEMRCTGGSIKLGGSVGYCPQSAWIQNATIRENVLFGSEFDEERYWAAIHNSCLERDLELLPNGDMTEVGEKGISLSGGQKQRLSICRALYSGADILIFDDPLSALDAHVGKAVFNNVLLKKDLSHNTTRVLVTHGLHFLPQVDYIYTMVDGRIAERGTYKELIEKGGAFAKFVSEFGGDEQNEGEGSGEGQGDQKREEDGIVDKKARVGAALMQAEERNTGAVSGSVYKQYIQAANGRVIVPMTILSLTFLQGASTMAAYWLVYWQERKWGQPQGFYMGIYAALGVAQAMGFFWMGAVFALTTYWASRSLHRKAVHRIMHAPMSFFDTTPLGRIMNRFSKDIDTIDNQLGDALRMFFATLSNIIGAIILISVVVPFFLIPVLFICWVYFYFAVFYRSSARELKRLDSILRSSLYAHFSESLTGLATIRAYGEAGRFKRDNERLMDDENRAYWLTVTNQRWLGIRLDFLGTILTLCVAILTIVARFSISPAQTGVALSYILLVQQAFGWMVRQSAEVENDMNAVERILHYANEVDQEAPNQIPDKKPPPTWPANGQLEFRDVVFKYRPELPAVLHNLSISIGAGEKIGIVGRTGAGKSSIMIALFRIAELTSGSMVLDGVDLSTIGLDDVRKAISIIPQEPLLFNGTMRTNLDPFGQYDDAALWDALKRAYLVEESRNVKGASIELEPEGGPGAKTPTTRFTLDTLIEDEGGNLSVGQRSLVSLARAIVKNSKVLVLDEATASVDYETDSRIQDTIASEFHDRTILCIAHRLRTIIGYDRICVMDAGQVAEMDTPINLYLKPDGIFRTMCEHSNITLDDLKLARKILQDEME